MRLLEPRQTYRPYEFDNSEVLEAITDNTWTIKHFRNAIGADVHDFKTKMDHVERSAVERSLLAVSQVEAKAVKTFWVNLGLHIPKPEFAEIGITFGESEVRHARAYAFLLQALDLNDKFEHLTKVPAIQGRIDYLSRFMHYSNSSDPQEYLHALTLFTLFIENVSLFSQFAIIKSFNKHTKRLNVVDNIVQATQQEEQVHAQFGIGLINMFRAEYPEWFNTDFYARIENAAVDAFEHECRILDWIFEEGELDFISIPMLKEFIKDRLNQSLVAIGSPPGAFNTDAALLAETRWFVEELHLETLVDFFNKHATTYSKDTQSYDPESIF